MTRRRLSLVVVLGAALTLQAPPASAHRFGDVPLQDVKDGAAAATRCSGLTASELAAMVLAPTWPEVAPGSDLTPSPMALGRWDTSSALYSPWSNTPRAFWHAGVGAWQIDTLNLNLAAFQKIRTNTAARFVARFMAERYCAESGSDLARRRAAFRPWRGCGDLQATCEDLYQEHYCPGTDNVCRITTDTSVGRLGGMKKRTCRYSAPGSTTFTCWYIDPANAQGHTGSWQQPPLDGGGGISPLAFAFYDYWTSDGSQEYRHWIRADTGYSRGEVFAIRRRGRDPRDGLSWNDADVLCDTTTGRGTC